VSAQLEKASDQLNDLSLRAARAEADVRAAKDKGQAQLKEQIDTVRTAAVQREDDLQRSRDQAESKVSSGWSDMQRRWQEHVAAIRQNAEDAKAHRDAKHAEKRAEDAENDALAALDFAYSALEEAEYQVLDAALARVEADTAMANDPRAQAPA
jgi:hypothetical protein